MGEILDRLHHLVERIDAHHADRLGDRVEAIERAGERAGMGERGFAALLGAADLDRDHRLAGIARVFAGAAEFAGMLDRFDEAGDRADVGIVGEIADVVRHVEPDLVAARHRVAGVDAAREQRAVDRHHDAAALADDRDRPAFELGDAVIGDGHQPARRREIAHAVRAGYREAGIARSHA